MIEGAVIMSLPANLGWLLSAARSIAGRFPKWTAGTSGKSMDFETAEDTRSTPYYSGHFRDISPLSPQLPADPAAVGFQLPRICGHRTEQSLSLARQQAQSTRLLTPSPISPRLLVRFIVILVAQANEGRILVDQPLEQGLCL